MLRCYPRVATHELLPTKGGRSPKETGEKLIVQNKKARHDYAIEDKYEAGLALTGTEVKSLRRRPRIAVRGVHLHRPPWRDAAGGREHP